MGYITSQKKMNLLFFTEARLGQTEVGQFYSSDQSFSYQMFQRYRAVYDGVSVIARCTGIKKEDVDENTRVDGSGVDVMPLPYYLGPYQYLIKRIALFRKIQNYIDANPNAAIICRVPGVIGAIATKYLTNIRRPYGVEVVGDPRDVFAPGSLRHSFRAVFRHYGVSDLKFAMQGASASIYVTKKTLQARYPHAPNTFSTFASNVMLPPEAFVQQAKILQHGPPYIVVVIGSLATMYKAPDIAIESIAILKKRGIQVLLQWIGDGQYLNKLKTMATKLDISDNVTFTGNIASATKLRQYLDRADLFALPSRTEGVSRALIEAMARGLPCIATEVGGIPELLENLALVPVNNAEQLAAKMEYFLNTPALADIQAKRNLLEAQSYAFENLEKRRIKFYQYLKGIS